MALGIFLTAEIGNLLDWLPTCTCGREDTVPCLVLAIHVRACAIRQEVRRVWTAVRTSGWLQALRALTAFGQWGLLIGLAGSTLLVTAALGGALPASILPVKDALSLANIGWLLLLALCPLTLWSARALLRRVSTVPAAFASHSSAAGAVRVEP